MKIPLANPTIEEDTRAEVDRVLQEEFFLSGDSVKQFEAEFAEYIGTNHAIAVDSGTQAIHLSLRALEISEGDTVLTTPATFISTANAIVRTGASVEFVDVNLKTYTMDLDAVAERLSERSDIDAIVPVHLYGYPVAIDRLRYIAGSVPIVSDSCQSHGAEYDGKMAGSMGDAGAFSFYPSKNMTVAGDGGMITTDNDEIARVARSLRDVGRSRGGYEHERIGFTARMNTVNAAIGRQQLDKLDEWNGRRRAIAERYEKRFLRY